MDWIDITVKKPRQKQDCIVLTERGSVERAIAHKGWSGGFCSSDGGNGSCVQQVTHWMPFKTPNVGRNRPDAPFAAGPVDGSVRPLDTETGNA